MCPSIDPRFYRKADYDLALLRPIADDGISNTAGGVEIARDGDIPVNNAYDNKPFDDGTAKKKGKKHIDEALLEVFSRDLLANRSVFESKTVKELVIPKRGRSRTKRPLGKAYDRQCRLCYEIFESIREKELHVEKDHAPVEALQEERPDLDSPEIFIIPGTPPLSGADSTDGSSDDSFDSDLLTPDYAYCVNTLLGEAVREQGLSEEGNAPFIKEHVLFQPPMKIKADLESKYPKIVVTPDTPPPSSCDLYGLPSDMSLLSPDRIPTVLSAVHLGRGFIANSISPILETPSLTILLTPPTPKLSLDTQFRQYKEDTSIDDDDGGNYPHSRIADSRSRMMDGKFNFVNEDGRSIAESKSRMAEGRHRSERWLL